MRFAGKMAAAAATILIVFGPLAWGQNQAAPHVSPDAMVLWFHGNEGREDEMQLWMNADALDADSDDIAAGPSQSTAATSASTWQKDYTWTVKLNPPIRGAVTLDSAGTIDIVLHIGSGGGQSPSGVDVTPTLRYGETEVAAGATKTHTFEPAAAQYPTVEWSLVPSLDLLEPGQDLVLTVALEGVATSVFMGIHEDRGKSRLSLPVLSADVASGEIRGQLEGAEPRVDLFANESINQTYIYNWTAPGGDFVVAYSAALAQNGTVLVNATDANGTIVLDMFLIPGDEGEAIIAGAAAGNWTVVIVLTEFAGSVQLVFSVPVPPEPVVAGPTDGGPDPNATAPDNQTQPTEGSPGAGLLASLVVAMAAGALAGRGGRRQR